MFETCEEWPQSRCVPPPPPPHFCLKICALSSHWMNGGPLLASFFLENHFYSWSSLLFHTEEWGRLSCMIRPKGEPSLEELGLIVFGKKRFQTAHVVRGKNGVRVLESHSLYSVIIEIIDEFLRGKWSNVHPWQNIWRSTKMPASQSATTATTTLRKALQRKKKSR